jgi:hypothetical protein
MDLSDQASSRNDGVEDTSPNVVMLKHPNGSQVSLPHFPSVRVLGVPSSRLIAVAMNALPLHTL